MLHTPGQLLRQAGNRVLQASHFFKVEAVDKKTALSLEPISPSISETTTDSIISLASRFRRTKGLENSVEIQEKLPMQKDDSKESDISDAQSTPPCSPTTSEHASPCKYLRKIGG